MTRYTVISADCHAGPSFAEGGYLEWIDPAYRERLQEDMARWSAMFKARMEKLFAPEFTAIQDGSEAAQHGGRSGAWDPHRRLKELSYVGSNAFGVEEVDGVRRHGIAHYLDLAAAGRVDIASMLTHTFTLDEWRDAFTALATQDRSGAIKVAFDFR